MSSTRFAHAIQVDGAAPKAGGTRGPTRTYAARTLANISAHIRARRSFSPEFPSDIAPTQLGREGSYKQPPKPPRHGISAGLLWLTACIAGDQPTSPLARQARRITGRKTAEQSAIHAHILRRSEIAFFSAVAGLPTAPRPPPARALPRLVGCSRVLPAPPPGRAASPPPLPPPLCSQAPVPERVVAPRARCQSAWCFRHSRRLRVTDKWWHCSMLHG